MPGNPGRNGRKGHDWWTEGSSRSPTGRLECASDGDTTGAFSEAFPFPPTWMSYPKEAQRRYLY